MSGYDNLGTAGKNKISSGFVTSFKLKFHAEKYNFVQEISRILQK